MNLINVLDFNKEYYGLDLFDEIKIPDKLDKEVLVNTILGKCWCYRPCYNDFSIFKQMVNNFFLKNYHTYVKMLDSLTEEYNPLHNYNRYEDRNENRKIVEENEHNANYKATQKQDTENKVSAFNSDTYQPSDTTSDNTESTNENEDSYNNNHDDTYITRNHLYGNIGVTTSQTMVKDEIELRKLYNIYDIIANQFLSEFMVGVYDGLY